ncbi:MAG: hypothetical protein KKC99_12895, partial [Proteobacteria bacterium]|nr:hypothetical protein [Pseudomonadota bacterium]
AAYEMIGGRPVSLVSTPMVAGETHSLTDQRFFASYETLFRALGPEVERTSFFPEGLIAYSPEMNASLILSKENRFQRPPEHARSTFHPQGLFINGRILPLHRLASGIRSILR